MSSNNPDYSNEAGQIRETKIKTCKSTNQEKCETKRACYEIDTREKRRTAKPRRLRGGCRYRCSCAGGC